MRDGADTCITICNMENFDPMGVHTGDSHRRRASQTLSDQEYQMLRSAALQDHPRARHRGRLQRPVRARPATSFRTYAVIEVQPARQPFLRARVEGDRLPDRPRRRQDRHRQAAGRDHRTRSPARRPPRSSRRSTTASSRSRAGRSTSSPLGDRTHRHPDEGDRRGRWRSTAPSRPRCRRRSARWRVRHAPCSGRIATWSRAQTSSA